MEKVTERNIVLIMFQTNQRCMIIFQHAVLNFECFEVTRHASRSLMMQQAIFLVDIEGAIDVIINLNRKSFRSFVDDRLKTFPQISPQLLGTISQIDNGRGDTGV